MINSSSLKLLSMDWKKLELRVSNGPGHKLLSPTHLASIYFLAVATDIPITSEKKSTLLPKYYICSIAPCLFLSRTLNLLISVLPLPNTDLWQKNFF